MRAPLGAAAAVSLGSLTNCGGNPIRCGEGTTEQGGQCLPLGGTAGGGGGSGSVTCGAGTTLVGNECLPTGTGGAGGGGTAGGSGGAGGGGPTAPGGNTLGTGGRHACALVSIHRLVDSWHLVEKLGQAAVLIHGEAEGRAALARWEPSLLNSAHAVSLIINALEVSRCASKRFGDARPVGDTLRYLRNHRERMGYSGTRALGLPIGRGNVEATCKSLVSLHFRRPGARWKEDSGQQVLDLRALALSDRFPEAIDLTLAPLRLEVRAAA